MPQITQSAATLADKWSNRLAGSATEIRAGVQAVQVSPMEKAVAQQDKMRANWLASIDGGKWAENTRAVTLAQWKDRMSTVGVDRITQGAIAGKPKMQAYLTEAIPVMNNLSASIEAMPKRNLQDSLNRVMAWMQGMSDFAANR